MGDRGLQLTGSSVASAASWRPVVTSAGLALGGGLAWGLCSGSETRAWLACMAFAPLVLLLQRPFGVLWAGFFSFVSWLVAMPWIPATLETFGGLPGFAASGLGALLAAYLALDTLLFAWLARRILRRHDSMAWWGLPALWVCVESLRGFFFGGFPWNLAAYCWVDMPGALALSAWVGASGVTFLVIAVNVALALAISRRQPQGLGIVWALIACLLIVGNQSGLELPEGPRPVRLIQPNSGIVTGAEVAWESYVRLIEMSHQACDEPALLIWPESAAWPFSWESTPRLRQDVEALVRLGCPVVLGSSFKRPSGILNGAMLFDGRVAQEPYAKRRLVPFGEYVPMADLLPFVGRLARNAGDFTAGTEPGLLQWQGEYLGMAICYEVIFMAPVAEQVRAGATILVTVTNDAWYGDSSAPRQHLRAARFRAAENRRPMLRAALTGISAIIDSRGRIVDSLGIGEQGALAAKVSGRRELTPFSRAPWASIAACCLLSILALGAPLFSRLRRD